MIGPARQMASCNAEAHVGFASCSIRVAKYWPGAKVGVSVSVAKLLSSKLVRD